MAVFFGKLAKKAVEATKSAPKIFKAITNNTSRATFRSRLFARLTDISKRPLMLAMKQHSILIVKTSPFVGLSSYYMYTQNGKPNGLLRPPLNHPDSNPNSNPTDINDTNNSVEF